MLGSSISIGSPNTLSSTAAPDLLDNVLFTLGNDRDIVLILKTATTSANEELAGIIEGTSVHPATAANTLILSNITNDGDILMLASDGGNSKAFLFFDSSTPDLYLYNVGGTWTGGATTWEIPAVTLGGKLTSSLSSPVAFQSDSFVLIEGEANSATAGNTVTFRGKRSHGTIASPAAVETNDVLVKLDARPYDGGGFDVGGYVALLATETHTASAHGQKMVFYTVDDTTTTVDLRMTIEDDGVVTIAQSLDAGSSCEANAYTVGGSAGIDESGSGTISSFTITIVKGIITAFAQVS